MLEELCFTRMKVCLYGCGYFLKVWLYGCGYFLKGMFIKVWLLPPTYKCFSYNANNY